MEAMEEVTATASPKDLCHIVKGKRTKRQRPQSPIPFTITTHSSSGDGGYGSNGDGDCVENNNNNNNNAVSSNSDEEFLGTTTTEEDEDMAKCLILLAQGHDHLRPDISNKIIVQDHDQNFGIDHNKFTSKRYIETPISTNGKAGMYVYQCKTCGRSFPSFQALGGHRASHKKPKNMAAAAAAEERKLFLASSDEEEEPFKNSNHGNRNRAKMSSLTLELGSRGIYNMDSSKSSTPTPKVHECSYCGAEFTSGQALGGHMRRHRGATVSATANTTLSLSPISPGSIDQETDEAEAKRPRYNLSLDLNLPAPEDDHNRDSSMLAFASKQPRQQQDQEKKEQEKTALVLSSRRLIECQN